MKKHYLLKADNDTLVLTQDDNSTKKFTVKFENLQFDTKIFYDVVFADIERGQEIEVVKDDNSFIQLSPELQKTADHVYDTIISIISQVCERLAEDLSE